MRSTIKHGLLSIVFALSLLGVMAVPASAQLGVAGGLNFESLNDIETSAEDNATLENATGYHLGVVYDLGLGPLHFRPGLFYRKVGSYDLPEGRSDVTAWEVPVDVRFTVLPLPLVDPYLLGGAKAVFMQGEGDFDDGLEDVSYTLNVGAGAEFSLPGVGLSLQPELLYEFGATDYVDGEFQVGGTTFSPSERKLSAFALRLNVIF